MIAYRLQILKYLRAHEKARTTEEIIEFLAALKGETVDELSERRRKSIMAGLEELEQDNTVLTKKTNNGVMYWACKQVYIDNAENELFKMPLKELVKLAKPNKNRRKIRFFQG